MTSLLPVLFALTALLYAAVGFGGGSTYNALLVLGGVDYRLIPSIALTCNIIVVAGGMWRFWQQGALSVRRMAPFLATSIPAAWIGGRIPISELIFVGLLGTALLLAGLRMLLAKTPEGTLADARALPVRASLGLGAGIGLLAGLVGIGGGIFLAPIFYMARWGSPQQIAGGCSLFIFCNSLSGLAGQGTKLIDAGMAGALTAHWPLALGVLAGGQIGSWLASSRLQPDWIKRLTAVLILYVAARLLLRFATSFAGY